MDKAEKILEDEWGKEKAKSMVEGYHRFKDKDSKHPDSCQNIGTFLEGLKGFRNQIKKKQIDEEWNYIGNFGFII